jgi:spoIIIJ-associated protein
MSEHEHGETILETSVEEETPADESGAAEDSSSAGAAENEGDGAENQAGDSQGADDGSDLPAEDVEDRPSRVDRLEREGDIAADYLEELLDIADLDGDLDMDVEGDRAAVSIVGADLAQLVGRDGEVLEALQELTRLAVYRDTGERSRLMLDISGYRADKRAELERLAADAVAQVTESGERLALEPMTAFERKVVHDVVTESGLVSESEGVEPRRFVVITPGR